MKRLMLILFISFLAFSYPVAAQSPEPYIESCDNLPLRDWPKSYKLQLQNGICNLQNANLSTGKPLYDFVFRSKISMGSNARLEFRYGDVLKDEFKFTITPSEAKLMNYIRFGNASTTVREKKLAQASLQISANEWVELEFGMQGHLQWLSINGEVKINRDTARFYGVDINGTGEIYLDDIQLIQNNLSVYDEILPSYPEGLVQTWIAYQNNNYELALIHPDGTGGQVLTAPPAEPSSIQVIFSQVLFSPDGKTLLVSQSEDEQTLLSFFSMEELQFVGSEIRLTRFPIYNWMPDGEHLIVLRDKKLKSVILEKINIYSGQVVATYILPSVIDKQTIDIQFVNYLECSSSADIVSFDVSLNVDGNYIPRAVLFHLISQQANFLPGASHSLWSPDGRLLFSTAGGLIDPQSLVFDELPSAMVKRISNYKEFAWSPNGQFIHVGTENAGNEAYSVYILDLEAKDVINLRQNNFGTFAPDSLHFVFSDSGRIIVRSLFDKSELQIAQGTNPIWQPAPDNFSIETILQGQPTNSDLNMIVPSIETTQATQGTETSEKIYQQEIVSSENGLSGNSTTKNHRLTWPIILGILSLAGLTVTGGNFYLNYFRLCPTCYKTNRGFYPFCMYCGNPLKRFARTIKTRIVIAMLIFSGCFAVAVIATLVKQPAQDIALTKEMTYKPGLENPETQRITAVSNNARPSSEFTCGNLDLTTSTLPAILQEIETNQTEMSEFIAQAYKRTPEANITREASLQETQFAELDDLYKKMCIIASLSISPDQRYILVSGSNYLDGTGQGFWASLYNLTNYQPIWVKPIEINSIPLNEIEWSPSGDAFAVGSNELYEDGLITIFATSTGDQISKFLPSTRKEAYCNPLNLEGNQFRWLQDGKHLVRKISNAIQILEATTGTVVKEIAFDDSVVGSQHYPPDDGRCFFRIAWDANGNRLATLDASLNITNNLSYNGLKIWDVVSGNLIAENHSNWSNATNISFSPDGKFLFVFGQTTSLIETSSGQIVRQLSTCPVCNYPAEIIWSRNGQKVLIREDNNIGLYDIQSENWEIVSLSDYSGNIAAWLEDGGNVLMVDFNPPTVVNILSGNKISLLEFFQSSQ